MAELKRCPFCGGEVILETVDGNSPEECYIYCPQCDFESGVYSKPKFIVEKWNRRADNVAPVVHGRWISWEEAGNFVPSPDRHECSVCHDAAQVLVNGFELLSDYCPNCGAKMDGGDSDAAD